MCPWAQQHCKIRIWVIKPFKQGDDVEGWLGFVFAPKCPPRLKGSALSSLWILHCHGGFPAPSHADVYALLGIWGLYIGRWGISWPARGAFFLCLPVFVTSNRNTPQRSQASKFLISKEALSLSWLGVEKAIHWNSFCNLCPLKSQHGVRNPLPAHSCPPPLPFMAQITQDILDLDLYDVYFSHKIT